MEGFIEAAERDGRAVKCCGEAFIFECRDAETADRICGHTGLGPLCYACGDRRIAVSAAHADKFRSLVRSIGLGIV